MDIYPYRQPGKPFPIFIIPIFVPILVPILVPIIIDDDRTMIATRMKKVGQAFLPAR